MTIRECCELMVKEGRVVKHGDTARFFHQDGSEIKTLYLNKTSNRHYFRCTINGKKRNLPAYNLIWLAHGNKLENGKTIDHIDRNRHNNSINNLRLATRSEQRLNCDNSKTNPEIRRWMRDQFHKGLKTIRGLSREMNLCRETVQDIIRMRYKLDQQLEGMGK